MREMIGDIFSKEILDRADAICFTSNGVVKFDGDLVMGAGVAKIFAQRYTWLPRAAGYAVRQGGNKVHIFDGSPKILSFPTKLHWNKPSLVELIKKSAEELMVYTDVNKWENVFLPFPGIGKGGLKPNVVRTAVENIFDDRVVLLRLYEGKNDRK
jgi:hypothetical protein